jgi:iron complex outermembrane recepter protein
MVKRKPALHEKDISEIALKLFGAFLLVLGIILIPVNVGTAQNAQTGEDQNTQSGNEEKTKDEEEQVQEPVEEEITVTGSRAQGRSAADTPAPVDIITSETIMATGATETGKALQLLVPSFNFSTTFVSDGTDIIRPATLRSLGPDQVLVLVNGKRRHQQSLLNVQQTIGRGSAGTDINAIPITAIDRIEVLRDGASAQYGSDAIAGVINIILKNDIKGSALLQGGQTTEGDGGNFVTGVNKGFRVGTEGVINLTGEYSDRGETNRAGPDLLRVNPPEVTQRLGDPDAQNGYVWGNAEIPAGNGLLYGFGGYSYRQGNSSGFFRPSGDGRTIPAIYPDGFLPTIITQPTDASAVVGYTGHFGSDWRYDAYGNWGRNNFKFEERNTANVSWFYEPIDPANPTGPRFEQTPTQSDTGTLTLNMANFGFDVFKKYDLAGGTKPLFLSTGIEWYRNNYQITAGDPASYSYGRTNNRNIVILDQTGHIAQPGAQGFPGWSPAEAVDEGRNNTALYIDVEAQLNEKVLLGGAARYEHYSDFGNTVIGKFSARVDFSKEFSLRGTISNGFRAPGVQQEFYSQRSTNLNSAGVLTDTLTARQDSPITREFGIPPLKEETSLNYTVGAVAQAGPDFRVTVDYYRIYIDNRIVFSSNIQPEDAAACNTPAGCPIRRILDPLAVGQILFFTNAINTTTWGLDIVGQYDWRLGAKSLLTLQGAFAFNNTDVTALHSDSTILPPEVLFDQAQKTLVEEGQPQQHYLISGTYLRSGWQGNVSLNYFGEVAGEGFTPGFKQVWGAKWLTDAMISYTIPQGLTFTFGGLNIFNVFPDKWDPTRAFPFPELGFIYGWETLPFGMNGASFYGRVDYRF